MDTTTIKPCKCTSTFQDKKYGAGLRLHRIATKLEAIPRERCTVCYPTQQSRRLKMAASGHSPLHSFPPKSKGPYYS